MIMSRVISVRVDLETYRKLKEKFKKGDLSAVLRKKIEELIDNG